MLGVSRMTIYRHRIEFGMSHDGMSSNMTDEELAVILRQMRRENPALGERVVMGHLRSMGFKITTSRVCTEAESGHACSRSCSCLLYHNIIASINFY
jgi:hypothetical protein